jgi:hypothetical protein
VLSTYVNAHTSDAEVAAAVMTLTPLPPGKGTFFHVLAPVRS